MTAKKNIFDNTLSENLLSVWLSLNASVRNERIVKSMTFREIFLCNILYAGETTQQEITASDIVTCTGILKSQVNKIVVSMEERGLLLRLRKEDDKRKILLCLTEQGKLLYQKEHAQILSLLKELVTILGEDKIKDLTLRLYEVTQAMQQIINQRT